MNGIRLAELGLVPDAVVRAEIRRLLRQRCKNPQQSGKMLSVAEFAQLLSGQPVAIATEQANEQHYETPPSFFEAVLGPRLKYSCCLYDRAGSSLAEAEERMLDLTCERAQLADGTDILELGCGWGSLTLWMAQRYPNSRITAISNAGRQREFILRRAEERGLSNVQVLTANMVDFQTSERFDRVVSVEMFEHMRNYAELFRRVAGWLRPDGLAFVHVFCHRGAPYLFEDNGASDWMSRHFFTGGTMPSDDLFAQFSDHLAIEDQWLVDGRHYSRTSEDWLVNLDQHWDELVALFSSGMNAADARLALRRWRIFFLACSELFGYEQGERWCVAHYRFRASTTRSRSEISAAATRG